MGVGFTLAMKQTALFCLFLFVSLSVASIDNYCENIQNCNECEESPHCGWCSTDSDFTNGLCRSSTKNIESCPRWRQGGENCLFLSFEQTLGQRFPAFCEAFSQCDECLESEFDCKYCPDEKKCLPSASSATCSVPFITQENEAECPLTKQDAGSSLTPFACVIVLFSFLICFM